MVMSSLIKRSFFGTLIAFLWFFLTVGQISAQNFRADTTLAGQCHQKGRAMISQRPDSAALFLQKAAEIYTNYKLYNEAAHSHYNLGIAHQYMRSPQPALECFLKAAVQYALVYGEGDPYVANACNSAGNMHKDLMNYEAAIAAYDKALDIRKAFYGDSHPKVAAVLNNLANLASLQNNTQEAIALYQEAIKIHENYAKFKDYELGYCYENLYLVYLKAFQYEEAEKNLLKLLSFTKKFSGEKSLPTATVYDKVGHFYSQQHNHAKTLSYYDTAYQIRQQLEYVARLELPTSYSNLGAYYLSQEQYKTAKMFFDNASAINKALRPQDASARYSELLNYVSYYQALQNHDLAISYYEKVLELFFTKNSTRFNDISFIYLNMSNIAFQAKNYELALQHNSNAYMQLRPQFESNALAIADIWTAKGAILIETQQIDSAMVALSAAQNIMQKYLSKTHDKLLQVTILKAKVLKMKGQNKEALQLLDIAFQTYTSRSMASLGLEREEVNHSVLYELLALSFELLASSESDPQALGLNHAELMQRLRNTYEQLQSMHKSNGQWSEFYRWQRFEEQRTQTEVYLNSLLK
ncbi:MAG: tetratricopeptide repeat protein [Cytophagales bacterium]|nr:MAG: tetratricopeptide repeat protein [Cytophagales bacterium]TAF61869.1 MAG: tetratricopeptide repeat protein [Cytophagales bacterium]